MVGHFYTLGKYLVLAGIFIVLLGFLIMLAGKFPGIGRLPGDVYVKRENFTLYFPLATTLILSLLLTVLLNIFSRR